MSISASGAVDTATFSNNYTEATFAIRGVVQSVYVRPTASTIAGTSDPIYLSKLCVCPSASPPVTLCQPSYLHRRPPKLVNSHILIGLCHGNIGVPHFH
jgi:hypothetical protein